MSIIARKRKLDWKSRNSAKKRSGKSTQASNLHEKQNKVESTNQVIQSEPKKKQTYSKVTARNLLLQLEVSAKGAVPTVIANMLGISVATVLAVRDDNFTDKQCEIFTTAANKYIERRDTRKKNHKNKTNRKKEKPTKSVYSDAYIIEKEARRLIHQIGGELKNHDVTFLANKLKIPASCINAVKDKHATDKQNKALIKAANLYINSRFTKKPDNPTPATVKRTPIHFGAVIDGLMTGIIESAVDVKGVTKIKVETNRRGERHITFFSNIDDEVESDQRMCDSDYNIKWIPTYNLALLQMIQC